MSVPVEVSSPVGVRRASRRAVVATMVPIVLVLGGLGVMVFLGGPRDAPGVVPGPVLPEGHPFVGAEQTTLEEAKATLAFDLRLPDDALASDETIVAVWTSIHDDQAAIDYASGLRIIESKMAPPPDLEAHFQELAQQVGGEVGTVNGAPALLIEASTEVRCEGSVCVEPSAQSSVNHWTGDVQIQITGDASVADLLRVAESLA